MADVQKELQKLKALINQRPTTAIFSNKSNESDKISNGDAEFFINDMSKKFVFTRAGIKNPVMVDPSTKTLENVEYINDVHIKEITEQVQSIGLRPCARWRGGRKGASALWKRSFAAFGR